MVVSQGRDVRSGGQSGRSTRVVRDACAGQVGIQQVEGNQMPRGRHATVLSTRRCQDTHSSCQPESSRLMAR